jgi:UDP-glucose 4-epimerase
MPEVNPSVYAATKVAALRLAEAYRAAYDLPVSHVRAYNAFGAGQAFGAGHPQKILPTFATRAWRGEPFPVWGDGLLLVDLIHVDQVARMLVDATGFGDGEMFDAGTGVPFTVLDVVNMVAETVGCEPKIEWLPWRKGERTEATVDDYASGQGWPLLNWRPTFDRGTLAETVESYR